MGSTLRVLPRSSCACAGVYSSSIARSIIHRLVRPGILIVIINLEWNKTSPADSPEDFITSIKTFGLMWTLTFRVPIPLVFDTSDSQFMVTVLKDTVETRNQLLASLVASRRPRLVVTGKSGLLFPVPLLLLSSYSYCHFTATQTDASYTFKMEATAIMTVIALMARYDGTTT